MYFNKKYLTTAGKNLLDQALSGSTIIWGKCATSSLNFANDLNSDVSQVRALTDIAVSSKYTSLGTVTSVNTISGDENSNLAINCSVTNASNANVVSGAASTFGVWAKIGSGGTETLVAVAFFDVDGGTPETIPSASQSAFSATVDLYVKTSDEAVSTITSNPSWMTPLDDFNNLKNRVVTTHSVNSPSTGDAQTIKGAKTFDNNTTFNGYTTFNNTVLFDDTVQCESNLGITGHFTADDMIANSLQVLSIDLGSIDNEPAIQFIAAAYEGSDEGELTLNFKTNSGGDSGGVLTLNDLDYISLSSVASGNIDASDYSLIVNDLSFGDDFKISVGYTDSRKQINFADGDYGFALNYAGGNSQHVTMVPYGSTYLNLGTYNSKLNNIYADYISVTSINASNMDTIIDNRISELFSTTTPLNTPRLVYIDAFNSGTNDYYGDNAYADAGDQTNSSGQLSLEVRYYIGTSIVSTGDYVSGKQLYLSDGTTATGTWEIVHSFRLDAWFILNRRRYFIAKRIA